MGTDQDRSENITGATSSEIVTRTNQADLKGELRVASGQRLSAGVQTVQQKVGGTVSYAQTQRHIDSLTLGYNGDYEAVQVQAGLRHDRMSGGTTATTGLLGAAVPVNEAWRVIGNLSTAFNLPTFNQLYFPGFGNADLKPERARSAEIGAQYEADGVLAKAVLFRTRYSDKIANATVNGTLMPVNVAAAVSEGVELAVSRRIEDWTVRANATYQEPKDSSTGAMLNRAARYFGSLDLARSMGPWQVGGQLSLTGSRMDGTNPLGSFVLANVHASWQFRPEWAVKARITNLGDVRYHTIYGYNQPGREAFLGVVWQP